MLSATWILALCAVALAAETPAAKPEVKEAPAGAHYGGAYGAPSYSQPQYPVFQFPNFDVNYCSVHASFPLVGLEKRERHRGNHHHNNHRGNRAKRQSYGVSQDTPSTNYNTATFDAAPQYSQPAAYGPAFFQRPRHFERQGCRNTAIYSRKSCQNCCQVASRAAGNSAPVVGLLLTFDPKLSADKKHHKKDDELNAPDRALQCVCCTSRRV